MVFCNAALRDHGKKQGHAASMSTVVKALSLLDHFDASAPEIGLVDMARLSGLDKATTRRLLVALSVKGLIEQDPLTRRYRLGAALVRLARIREAAVPLIDIARPIVEALSRQSGETVHVSQIAGDVLSSVFVCESPYANRVSVAVGQKLPFNCTASGLAFLCAAPENFRAAVLKGPLVRMTKNSATTPAQLKKRIEEAARQGYARSNEGFEMGVVSVAAPIIAANGVAVGAISVTSPAARADEGTMARHGAEVRAAAASISAALGGRHAAA
jgi:DNA-binding IclR family transcriptional regulator